MLRAIQSDHLASLVAVPLNGQLLALVFMNLSWAKHRFDSTADPVAKLSLMLVPVATLLAYIGSDHRNNTQQRDRARDMLQRLNAKCCTALGSAQTGASSASNSSVCSMTRTMTSHRRSTSLLR